MTLPINELRAMYARQKPGFEATDDSGHVMKGDEAAAYYEGRARADRATELLKRAGIVLPELEGMYEHQDTHFRQALKDIADSTGVNPKVVYNPGSGRHVTLATAFPEARAIFADPDVEAMHDVKSGGYEAHVADMHTFEPPDGVKADITLILNAGYMTEGELNGVVADNGLVVVNNWHGARDFMVDNCPDYKLLTDVQTVENVYPHGVDGQEDTNTLYVFMRGAANQVE